MSLSDHLDRIQHVCAKAAEEHNWPLGNIFRSGLLAILESRAVYDSIVDEKNPFYREFALCSQQDNIGVDELFCIFECLVIFIRMRQMAKPQLELSATEQEVLEYFETSGEWTACDDTVVSQWYWQRLPKKCCNH
jgi:hypothetical protein